MDSHQLGPDENGNGALARTMEFRDELSSDELRAKVKVTLHDVATEGDFDQTGVGLLVFTRA
jgi:hypothetical protein